MKKNIKDEKGFSLVELAISVTVIGVLIAGVVKGQEVLDNSRVAATASKVGQYRSGVTSFVDLYDELPGDMTSPQTKIPGCAGTACTYGTASTDGDGDGQIDGIGIVTATESSTEGRGFWEHLSAAGIVTDTEVGATAGRTWGTNLPRTPFGGGFTLMLDPTDVTTPFGNGVYLRTSRTQTGFGSASGSLMTPLIARSLDRKLDNGFAGTGSVLSSRATTCQDTNGAYVTTTTSKDCDVLIKLLD